MLKTRIAGWLTQYFRGTHLPTIFKRLGNDAFALENERQGSFL
jgi:hypothetical protein